MSISLQTTGLDGVVLRRCCTVILVSVLMLGLAAICHADAVFPLKLSPNRRYLVDQNNVPFLMIGDSPQDLIGKLSPAQAGLFMANRQSHGVNALWINLLCNWGTGCNSDGSTFDGIAPFLEADDLATPNPAYFERAAQLINLAASHGMVVVLDPIETIGWLSVLRLNGPARAFAFGQYLGNRFKDIPNIIWMHGNDFQTWTIDADDAVVRAVAEGIGSVERRHLQTVELNYVVSASLDNPAWEPLIGLNAVYTYRPTYAKLSREYRRSRVMPIFMIEANYEFEHNTDTDGGSTRNLRKQAYWTALSGAAGQFYGSFYSWQFPEGWQNHLDTPGIRQFSLMAKLFAGRRWHDLIPDLPYRVFANGRGVYNPDGSITTDTFAAAARTSDGSLAIAYMPTLRPLTVDMTKLAGPVAARWFDPANGATTDITGSPFSATGFRTFTPPGKNSDGEGDWVLILETR